MDSMTVTDNAAARRFELPLDDGAIAFCDYRIEGGDTLVLTHARVPDQHGGKGIGGKLAAGVYAAIRDSGRKARPLCSFMVAYADRHPELTDIIVR